jgi:chromosome segregation protein
LLEASGTPFCVMDEVDAMLDEANVGRFRRVLQSLATRTQFIIISHNRHTIEAADVIYGITMGEDGTSRTLSLMLDEAKQVVAAG